MTDQAFDIEAIVRDVVARLNAGSSETTVECAAVRNEQPSMPRAQLVVESRVVTLAELAGRLSGMTSVVAPAKAVVTPAAKDLLREHGVSLSYAVPPEAVAPAAAANLVLATASTTFDAADVIATLARHGVVAERLATTGLPGIVGEMATEVTRGGKLGLIITGDAHAAVCLANRRHGIRAAWCMDVATVERSLAAIGTNVLIVDPVGRGARDIARLVERFCRTRERSAAPEYRDALG